MNNLPKLFTQTDSTSLKMISIVGEMQNNTHRGKIIRRIFKTGIAQHAAVNGFTTKRCKANKINKNDFKFTFNIHTNIFPDLLLIIKHLLT